MQKLYCWDSENYFQWIWYFFPAGSYEHEEQPFKKQADVQSLWKRSEAEGKKYLIICLEVQISTASSDYTFQKTDA